MAGLVADLKRQGYTLLLGSNTNILHARFYRRLVPRRWTFSITWSSRTRSAR